MMNENVVSLLKAQPWTLGICGTEPNAVPVLFKDVTDDGKLVVGDVFLNTTLKNLEANDTIAVSAFNGETLEGYQVKGRAQHIVEGPVVDEFKKIVSKTFNGAATAKGALIITPEQVIVTTPGGENGKEI